MSIANDDSIRAILFEVKKGLAPYVVKNYKRYYSGKAFLVELKDVAITLKKRDVLTEEEAELHIDSHGCLHAIVSRREVFRNKLGHDAPSDDPNVLNGFNSASELLNVRNVRGHNEGPDIFSDNDVFRIADTATRLLKAVKAREQAAKTEEVLHEFGEKLYIPEELTRETIDQEPQPAPTAEPIVQIVREPPPRVDLRGARLRKMDLRNRELRFAVLSGAKLEESNLRGEELSEARLDHASLKGADLSDANLAGADLSKADLNDAMLSHAILRRSKFHGTKLRHANMEFADLRHANLTNADMDSANLRNADLSYANLSDANLIGTDFRGANLQGAELQGAQLEWDGIVILNKRKYRALFDYSTILPDGIAWRHSTNMTKFTNSPNDR